MKKIHEYVVNTLFERGKYTATNLIDAIDTILTQEQVEDFLTILVYGKEDLTKPYRKGTTSDSSSKLVILDGLDVEKKDEVTKFLATEFNYTKAACNALINGARKRNEKDFVVPKQTLDLTEYTPSDILKFLSRIRATYNLKFHLFNLEE